MKDTQNGILKIEKLPERKKPPTNGRGVGIWLLLSGVILFAFERYCGLSDWLMWTFRVVGLLCLLIGAVNLGMSFERVKE